MGVSQSTRKLQLGAESSPGTKVAATTIWRGPASTLVDERKIHRIAEHIGILAPTNRTQTLLLGVTLTMPSQAATFEQLPYIGAAGIKNITSGTPDGGSGKIYTYTMPVGTNKNTIKTYTIEAGNAQQAEAMEFGFVEEFSLAGGVGEHVMLEAKWRGRQVIDQAFTSALNAPAVESIPFQKSKLYIDDTGGIIGTTQALKTFVRFKLNVKTGWRPLPAGGDGTLYFPDIDYADPDVTLDLTFIYDTTATGARSKWRSETGALIRMLFEGSALSAAGGYSRKTLIIDLAGKWMSFKAIEAAEGIEICTGTFEAMYDPSANLLFEMTIVNEVSALP